MFFCTCSSHLSKHELTPLPFPDQPIVRESKGGKVCAIKLERVHSAKVALCGHSAPLKGDRHPKVHGEARTYMRTDPCESVDHVAMPRYFFSQL